MSTIVDIMILKELGYRLRKRRKALKLTQEDLARMAGCSKPSVIAAEQGKPTLQTSILIAIASALGLRLELRDDKGP